jgi:hypothetical protein
MRALAEALIDAVAFLELSEDAVDPDAALGVLETIAGRLSTASPQEKQALAEALAARKAEEESGDAPSPEYLEFLDTFLYAFGLGDEDEGGPARGGRLNLL